MTGMRQSNPSRVNCDAVCQEPGIFSPRVPGRCHRDEMNGLYCQPSWALIGHEEVMLTPDWLMLTWYCQL